MLNSNEIDSYTQISTSQTLCSGLLETNFKVKDLLNYGDFGFGATAGMQHNIMILDGEIISPTLDFIDEHVAISFISHFTLDGSLQINNAMGIKELRNKIQDNFNSTNIINLVKIKGNFDFVKTSSFPKFSRPYPVITADIVNRSVNSCHYSTSGTLLAFWLPEFCKCINAGAGGLHIHYISNDKKICGHVLDCNISSGTAEFSSKHTISLKLPESSEFQNLELGSNDELIDNRIEAWAKDGVGGKEL
ncbi:TPA: acetolactate decarboxylase [Yersinia enterocolitica]|uniref:acetolactate decarboxylase n=1 Tax=Yersinia enterocolitica TaxID=630 RepID=UPI0005E13C61|nr:acetolactate decarboxylase [Yersinia enterocolitica]EKN6047605.1 hypothetical protein [Yersinia enterocolitica]CQJ38156.1 alpha-acetolactate decarboxylase [Yersinia enterocolitica]HEN3245261.1 acetolactate decarboxylase [Yersinia enterocolitica]